MTKTSPNDFARTILNLIVAPAMMIISNIPMIMDAGRSPSEFSDQNGSLLVPFGIAFSIWFPIFILSIIYGIVQFMPANRTREVFRQTGWWTAAGFAFVVIWSLISGFAPSDIVLLGTAFTFVPMVYCLIRAMLCVSDSKDMLSTSEGYMVWLPISLIAGWTSIAMFLNFTPITADLLGQFGITEVIAALIMLTAALIFAVMIIRLSRGNRAYAFPIVWGLFWLGYARYGAESPNLVIAISAVVGFFIIIAATLHYGRLRNLLKT